MPAPNLYKSGIARLFPLLRATATRFQSTMECGDFLVRAAAAQAHRHCSSGRSSFYPHFQDLLTLTQLETSTSDYLNSYNEIVIIVIQYWLGILTRSTRLNYRDRPTESRNLYLSGDSNMMGKNYSLTRLLQ